MRLIIKMHQSADTVGGVILHRCCQHSEWPLALTTAHLKEKLAKLASELQRLKALPTVPAGRQCRAGSDTAPQGGRRVARGPRRSRKSAQFSASFSGRGFQKVPCAVN